MSNTERHVDENALYPSDHADAFGVLSQKHHRRDRSYGSLKSKHRFAKGCRNSRHNLAKKAEEADWKEQEHYEN